MRGGIGRHPRLFLLWLVGRSVWQAIATDTLNKRAWFLGSLLGERTCSG
jgi:hypothetical protein